MKEVNNVKLKDCAEHSPFFPPSLLPLLLLSWLHHCVCVRLVVVVVVVLWGRRRRPYLLLAVFHHYVSPRPRPRPGASGI